MSRHSILSGDDKCALSDQCALSYEPRHEKTCFLHMQKQRGGQISCTVTKQVIRTFDFAT